MRLLAAILTALALLAAPGARAQEEITYMFPAPEFLPAFAPYQLAKARGYYEERGIDVTFLVGRGGADVAKQVAVGNVDIGHAIGDAPIIVRANGLPVKVVALLGGRALTQLAIREETGVADIAGLEGKRIGVMSFQDVTFYNLLAALASEGLTRDDVEIQAVGPQGVVQLMISGDLDAISSVPEWSATIEDAGVPVTVLSINDIFPALAQAILASDETIEERPELVRDFVAATMQGLRDVIDDPAGSAAFLAETVPAFEGQGPKLQAVMEAYGELVYAMDEGETLGHVNPERLAAVQDFYVDAGIVARATPIEDLYTNEFVERPGG